jgi:hypothetical protein
MGPKGGAAGGIPPAVMWAACPGMAFGEPETAWHLQLQFVDLVQENDSAILAVWTTEKHEHFMQ